MGLEWEKSVSKTTVVWLLIIILFIGFYINAKNSRNEKNTKLAAERIIKQTELKERFSKGAFIANESKISEFETTKTIIYPGRSEDGENYDTWYDTTCFVYTNTQLNQSKIKCTGMLFDQEDEANNDMQEYQTTERYGRYE